MNKSILRRLEELEQLRPHFITVLAKNMVTGEEREMPMRELIERFGEWSMERVLDGNDLKELDEYLSVAKEYFSRCKE